ncbi:DUF559 domain-containing protein [Bacillus velezensis]|uniref:DUF559 domain-containing protein n=1 Tax=Bacillus amyloliquefaciens group TaxID=1938374 RepID=UPI002DBDA733|nr:DUF559 domain-containing protein [Bacillus velezensis]MEC2153240.1 DUF559 domain-containing protein [Bacillus velezensis]MEC2157321.1 DUF559 domain-containing protein [Bacillus velezensis]MEE4534954.1 DUF559 domain-containing protein [Bacillus velezensis]
MNNFLQILNQVKKINTLPATKELTLQMLSDYYEVSVETIRTVVKRNMKVLKHYDELRLIETKNMDNELLLHLGRYKKVRKLSLVNINGVIRIGLLLKDSFIARQFQKKVRNLNWPKRLSEVVIGNSVYKAKEKKLGLFINTAFKNVFSIEQQVKCGGYFIDYVIDKKVAIECDEHGHKYYPKHKELEREEYIKRNGYKLIRFNPDSEESIFELINRVFMECQTA